MGHRRTTPLLVSLLIMCHILKVLFHGFTAADVWLLIIELVILALIADERIRSWRYDLRAQQLLDLISRGEDLRNAIPTSSDPKALQEKCTTEVRQWIADATALVQKCGPSASKIFQCNQGVTIPEVYLLPQWPQETIELIQTFGNQLRALQKILGDRITAGWF